VVKVSQVTAGSQIDQKLLTRVHFISKPRMDPYLRRSNGNVKTALNLYHWNVDFSAAAYEALHILEVVMRNSMDAQLCAWNSQQVTPGGASRSADWLIDPAPVLMRLLRGDHLKAQTYATFALKNKRQPLHVDMLAQLTFGTWRFLLPAKLNKDAGRDLLWRDALASAFPRHRPTDPAPLVRSIGNLYRLRNRVAHLEPLLDVNAQQVFKDLRRVLGAIDQNTEDWVVARQRITTVAKRKPSP
jgi:hypothetical protein